MEIELLRYLRNKDNYNNTIDTYVTKASVSTETWDIIQVMGDCADHDEPEDFWDEVRLVLLSVRHPTWSDEKKEVYSHILDQIISDPNDYTSSSIDQLNQRMLVDRVFDKASVAASTMGDDSLEELFSVCEEFTTTGSTASTHKPEDHPEMDFTSLLATTKPSTGLRFRLKELDGAMGTLSKGDFVIISARPDSGKTTLLASEATYMAPQVEGTVLWFNNEEPGERVMLRIMQSAVGLTREEIEDDVAAAQESYNSLMKDSSIEVIDKSFMHVRDIESTLRRFDDVTLIIIDQLWKVHGFENTSTTEVDRQTKLFAWAREKAKEVAPVLTVHQADGTAAGSLWIEMNQLYGSKTAIQGEADAIVTLGRKHESGYENVRGLYLPKNKMTGSDPASRNGKFEITIKPSIGRFEGT